MQTTSEEPTSGTPVPDELIQADTHAQDLCSKQKNILLVSDTSQAQIDDLPSEKSGDHDQNDSIQTGDKKSEILELAAVRNGEEPNVSDTVTNNFNQKQENLLEAEISTREKLTDIESNAISPYNIEESSQEFKNQDPEKDKSEKALENIVDTDSKDSPSSKSEIHLVEQQAKDIINQADEKSEDKQNIEPISSETDSSASVQSETDLPKGNDNTNITSNDYFGGSISALLELQKEVTRIDSMVDENTSSTTLKVSDKDGKDDLPANKDNTVEPNKIEDSGENAEKETEKGNNFVDKGGNEGTSASNKEEDKLNKIEASENNAERKIEENADHATTSDAVESSDRTENYGEGMEEIIKLRESSLQPSLDNNEKSAPDDNKHVSSSVENKPDQLIIKIKKEPIDDAEDSKPLLLRIKDPAGQGRARKRGTSRKTIAKKSSFMPKKLVVRIEKMNFKEPETIAKSSNTWDKKKHEIKSEFKSACAEEEAMDVTTSKNLSTDQPTDNTARKSLSSTGTRDILNLSNLEKSSKSKSIVGESAASSDEIALTESNASVDQEQLTNDEVMQTKSLEASNLQPSDIAIDSAVPEPLKATVGELQKSVCVKREKQAEENIDKVVARTVLSKLSNVIQPIRRTFFCEICSLSFNCIRRYWNHKNLLHQNHEFDCVFCDKKFAKTSALLHHSKYKHKESTEENEEIKKGDPSFYCEACGKGFRNIQNRVTHIQDEHKEGYIFCSLCDHACSNLDDFVFHAKKHKQFKNTLFSCKVCGQNVFFLHMFINHIYGHENVISPRKFHCKVCSYKIKGFKKFVAHMERHIFTCPKYYCFICERRFSSNKKLELHIKYRHQNNYLGHQKFLHLRMADISAGKDCYWCGKVVPKKRFKLHCRLHKKFFSFIKTTRLITCKVCLKVVAKTVFKKHLMQHEKQAKNITKERRLKAIKSEKIDNKEIVLKSLYIDLTKTGVLVDPDVIEIKPKIDLIDITSDNTDKSKSSEEVKIKKASYKIKEKEGAKTKSEDVFKRPALPPQKLKPGTFSGLVKDQNRDSLKSKYKLAISKSPDYKSLNYKIPKKSDVQPAPTKTTIAEKETTGEPTGKTEELKKIDTLLTNRPAKQADALKGKQDDLKSKLASEIAAKIEKIKKKISSTLPVTSPLNRDNSTKQSLPPWKGFTENQHLPYRGPPGLSPRGFPPRGPPFPPTGPRVPIRPGPGPNQFFHPRSNLESPFGPPGVVGPPGVDFNQGGFGGPFPPNNSPFFSHPGFLNQQQQAHSMGGFSNQGMPFMGPPQFVYNEQSMAMYPHFSHGDYNSSYMAQWQGQPVMPEGNQISPTFLTPNIQPSNQCSGCQKTFPNAKVVGVHEIFCIKLVDKLSTVDQHICPVCSQKFNNLAVIKQHLFVAHAQIFKDFGLITGKDNTPKNVCKTCKQVFNSTENLKAHEKTHEFLQSLKSDLAKVQGSATIVGKPQTFIVTGTKTSTTTTVSRNTTAKQSRFDIPPPGSNPSGIKTSFKSEATTSKGSKGMKLGSNTKRQELKSQSDRNRKAESTLHSGVQEKQYESLKKTQEEENLKYAEHTKILETIKSPAYKKNLEQHKKKLKINLLYFQKQKLEKEKHSKGLEMLKAEQELQRIQKELVESQRTGHADEIDAIDLTNIQKKEKGNSSKDREFSRKTSFRSQSPARSHGQDMPRYPNKRRSRSRSNDRGGRGRRISPIRERIRVRSRERDSAMTTSMIKERRRSRSKERDTSRTINPIREYRRSRSKERDSLRTTRRTSRSRSKSRHRYRKSPSPKTSRRRSRSVSPKTHRRKSRSKSSDRSTIRSQEKFRERSRSRSLEKQTTKLVMSKAGQDPAYRCPKCATLFTNYRDFIIHKDAHENSDEDEENYLTLLDPPPPPVITGNIKAQSSSSSTYDSFQKSYASEQDIPSSSRYYSDNTKHFTTQYKQKESSLSVGAGPSFLQRQQAAGQFMQRTPNTAAQYGQMQQSHSMMSSRAAIPSSTVTSSGHSQMSTAYAHLQSKAQYGPARVKCRTCNQEFPSQEYLSFHACSGSF